MAALAFTAYGVHWWAIGLNRILGGDPRLNGFMSIAFTVLSVLGVVVFFGVSDWPVAVLFIGLTLITSRTSLPASSVSVTGRSDWSAWLLGFG
jgi:hypothetical protein